MEMVMKMRRRKLSPSFVFIFNPLSLHSHSSFCARNAKFIWRNCQRWPIRIKSKRHLCQQTHVSPSLPLSFSLGAGLPAQRECREGRQVSWGTAWKQDNQSCSLAPDSNLNATFDKSTYNACREYCE